MILGFSEQLAHLQVRGIAGEVVQEMVNFIYQCVAEGDSGFYFLFVHNISFFEPQRYIKYEYAGITEIR